MFNKRFAFAPSALAGGLMGLLVAAPLPAVAQSMDPDAAKVLSQMQTYLGGLEAFSVNVASDFDVITRQGQKLKFLSSGTIDVSRPGKMHVTRKGAVADVDIVLDGETLTIFGKGLNAYLQRPATTVDEAIVVVRDEIGFPAPGADFLAAKPLDLDVTDVVTGVHVGMTTIDGETVHHLAFRGEDTDWQIWIRDGDEPLPVRYVVTSKWLTGAPEYSISFSDWDVAPAFADGLFGFTPPDGAKQISSIAVDETGEITDSQE